jgi:hypothetical protein
MHPIETNIAPNISQEIQNQPHWKTNPITAVNAMAITAQIALAVLLMFEIWIFENCIP